MARVMGKESSKLEKDLEGLKKRIQTSRKKLREAEIKARNLQSSIETALLALEKAKRHRKT
jgi:chaperonin cofactor prefoldin